MSMNFQDFVAHRNDAAERAVIDGAASHADIAEGARALGYAFTTDEVAAWTSRNLSDQELARVAGGGQPRPIAIFP